MNGMKFGLMLVVLGGFAIGCSQSSGPADANKGKASAEGRKYLLEVEPTGVRSLLDVRKEARDGDDIVMVARIAGSEKPFVDQRASFTVADLSIKPCPESEGCPTPWDCCCVPREDLVQAIAQVKFVDENGKTLNVSAKELLGVRELSVVVVKGKADRDEKDNLTVIANGIFLRKNK